MNTPDPLDEKWQALLARATPTFAGEAAPPYGFATSTLARLRAETGERELLERIGLRALFASVAVLVAVAVFSVRLQPQSASDLDPGMKSVVQVDNIPIS